MTLAPGCNLQHRGGKTMDRERESTRLMGEEGENRQRESEGKKRNADERGGLLQR